MVTQAAGRIAATRALGWRRCGAALVGGGVALITVLPARRLATSTVARLRTGPLRSILLHT